jgi:hypothetical protein
VCADVTTCPPQRLTNLDLLETLLIAVQAAMGADFFPRREGKRCSKNRIGALE